MLRTSSYTIYVDLPDQRDEMLLVHGYTGAWDRVSRRVANYLRGLEVRRPPKPLYGVWSSEPDRPEEVETPPDDTLSLLENRGYLTRLDPKQEETLFGRLAVRLHARAQARTPSYVFMPTYDCNLRCSYCFQDHMRTDGAFRHLLHTMSAEMVDRLFAAVPEIESLHGLEPDPERRREIGFFGGEPLLARHRDVVERIMRRARELGDADFWAVSNATELDAYADLLGPGDLGRIQITLDGTAAEHDLRRIYADGSGSYERIARNIDLALDRGVVVSVRLNIDRQNIELLPAVAEEFIARGWAGQPNFSPYTAPINAVNDQTARETTFNSWQLDQELTRMRDTHDAMRWIGRPDESIRVRARKIFDQREAISPQLRPSFCGAHDQMYILDPFGDVYACWERTGDVKIRIAHIEADGTPTFQHEIQRDWRSRSVASNPVCKRCRYALHCGGGCAILALGQRGKLHANYCDGYASRFRASVADAFIAHRTGEEATHLHDRVCDL
ncbi:MAG: radical SAM protein [Acidobacteriota bacterium]